jgi:hypothetical protein
MVFLLFEFSFHENYMMLQLQFRKCANQSNGLSIHVNMPTLIGQVYPPKKLKYKISPHILTKYLPNHKFEAAIMGGASVRDVDVSF